MINRWDLGNSIYFTHRATPMQPDFGRRYDSVEAVGEVGAGAIPRARSNRGAGVLITMLKESAGRSRAAATPVAPPPDRSRCTRARTHARTQGSYGTVYRASDKLAAGRRVAIKSISGGALANAADAMRVLREMRVLRLLRGCEGGC